MESFLEFLPIVGLIAGTVLGYSFDGEHIIYYIAAATLVATALQFVGHVLFKIKIKKVTLITGVLVFVFFGATLIFQNESFTYIKPTVLSWLLALGFYLLPKIKGKTAFDYMLNGQLEVSHVEMIRVNNWWVWFNIFAGLVNLLIYIGIINAVISKDYWVGYKFALIFVSMAFTGFLIFYLFKHSEHSEDQTEKPNKGAGQ